MVEIFTYPLLHFVCNYLIWSETPQLCNTTRARGQSPPSTCRFSDIFLKPFQILM